MFKKVLRYNRLCVDMFLLCVIKVTLSVMIFYPIQKFHHILRFFFKRCSSRIVAVEEKPTTELETWWTHT
jgi:hypothetical protein